MARKAEKRGVAGTLMSIRAGMALQSARVMWWTVAFVAFVAGAAATGQEAQPAPTFKSGVDLVTVRAVVRDGRGRPVTNLSQDDFLLLDRGVARHITSFDRDRSGVGVALLFDVSGSMDVASKAERARDLAFVLLANLRDGEDEAAIYAFDSSLHLVQPFTSDLTALKGRLSTVSPWGVTSLHDAIAAAAQSMNVTTKSIDTRRRALVVLTDGVDNSSRLSPPEVSRIASAIDVPVYIVAIVQPVDLQEASGRRELRGDALREGTLADLARWTGGQLFSTTVPAQSSAAARRILEDLRHQYLIAFEPGREPGWHPLDLRVRQKDHTVQSRSGYVAGASRPSS
jgi:Ca-activated chloride channel family protein